MTTIQWLVHTAGLDSGTVMLAGALKKQRNVADCCGDIIPQTAVADCIAHAERLFQ